MAKQRGGFVVIQRSIFEHPDLRNFKEVGGFIWLILQAAHSPTKVKYKGAEIVLERGQLAVSVRDFARAMEVTPPWVQRFFARLEKSGMIKRDTPRYRSDTRCDTPPSVITICNYSKYQDLPKASDTPPDTRTDTPADTQNNHRDNILPLERVGTSVSSSPTSVPNEKVIGGASRKKSRAWKEGEDLPVPWRQWAAKDRGWSKSQVDVEAQRFIDHALAKGRVCSNWYAAWRNWCRSQYCQTPKQSSWSV